MIYLDHASTTKPSDFVCYVVDATQRSYWGNTNSIHDLGIKANSIVRAAESQILNHINGIKGRIIWTSGGTEANNLAIQGTCENQGDLAASAVEHKSINQFIDKYSHTYYSLDYPERLGRWGRKLISFMLVNNETGRQLSNYDIEMINKHKETALFHTDAVQALGKIEIDVEKLGCDMMSLSAHKIYGPKGIGCLWVREGVELKLPYRGTPNVPAIAGFGEAAKRLIPEQYLEGLRFKEDHLLLELKALGVEHQTLFNRSIRLPGIISISFPNVNNIALVVRLDSMGVIVSIGSACSGKTPSSRVLKYEGFDKDIINSAIRISLGNHCTFQDLNDAAAAIAKAVQEIKNGS